MESRQVFHNALRELEDRLIEMSDLVGRAILGAVDALVDHDAERARAIVAGDERVNAMWTQVEQGVMTVIATQQPMAGDLRELLAITGIAIDLERVGDHGKRIAMVAVEEAAEAPLPPNVALQRMAGLAEELLRRELDAFVARDADLAREVAARDRQVDELYDQVYAQIVAQMTEHPETIGRGQRLLTVAKSLERVGDHVTNIGERVVFLTTGQLVELN